MYLMYLELHLLELFHPHHVIEIYTSLSFLNRRNPNLEWPANLAAIKDKANQCELILEQAISFPVQCVLRCGLFCTDYKYA